MYTISNYKNLLKKFEDKIEILKKIMLWNSHLKCASKYGLMAVLTDGLITVVTTIADGFEVIQSALFIFIICQSVGYVLARRVAHGGPLKPVGLRKIYLIIVLGALSIALLLLFWKTNFLYMNIACIVADYAEGIFKTDFSNIISYFYCFISFPVMITEYVCICKICTVGIVTVLHRFEAPKRKRIEEA